jgi:MFS family permease
VLHGGPDTLGLLTAAMGLGALLGALRLAYRKSVFGLSLIAFSFSHVLWLSMLLLVLCGFAVMMETAASNTVLQTIVDDDKRGRVMSFYAMAFLGAAPLGSLVAGSLASHFGVARVVQLSGLLCIAGSLVFAWRLPVLRKIIRPIYQRIGILPDATSGIPCEAEIAISEDAAES